MATIESTCTLQAPVDDVWGLVRRVALAQLLPSTVTASQVGNARRPPVAVGATRVLVLKGSTAATSAPSPSDGGDHVEHESSPAGDGEDAGETTSGGEAGASTAGAAGPSGAVRIVALSGPERRSGGRRAWTVTWEGYTCSDGAEGDVAEEVAGLGFPGRRDTVAVTPVTCVIREAAVGVSVAAPVAPAASTTATGGAGRSYASVAATPPPPPGTVAGVPVAAGAGTVDKQAKAVSITWTTSFAAATGAPHAALSARGDAVKAQHTEGFLTMRRLLGIGAPRVMRLFDESPAFATWRATASENSPKACGDAVGAAAGASEGAPADTVVDATVLDVETNTFVTRPAAGLRVGDMVRVVNGGIVPADLMLLWSSSPVQTALNLEAFDGLKDLRLRKPVQSPALTRVHGAGSSSGDSPGGAAADAPMMIACAVCTVRNPSILDTCECCGSPLGGGGGGGDSSLALLGKGAGSAAEGTDPASVYRALREVGTFSIPPPRADGKFEARFTPAEGEKVKMDHQQLLPRLSKLVFTEAVVGVVVYTGADTKYAIRGGAANAVTAKAEAKRAKKRVKRQKERAEARKAARLAVPVDPGAMERDTGIFWEDKFTDVPDDGNCGMHAFWKGLTTLLKLYPELHVTGEPPLADTAVGFRHQALKALAADEQYMASVDSQLRLYLSLDANVLANSVEDFFTLPSDFQSTVMDMNKQAHKTGTEGLDVEALCAEYVTMLGTSHVTGEGEARREAFVPLGEIELAALCRIYKVRLQTVKSEAVSVKRKGKIEDISVDPRCIRPEHILDRFATGDAKRYVRVLNVRSNHYQVHLPRPRPGTTPSAGAGAGAGATAGTVDGTGAAAASWGAYLAGSSAAASPAAAPSSVAWGAYLACGV